VAEEGVKRLFHIACIAQKKLNEDTIFLNTFVRPVKLSKFE